MAVKKKPSTRSLAPKPGPEGADLTLIRKLAEILNDTGLTEIELDHNGTMVRVSKATAAAPAVHYASAPAPQAHAPTPAAPITSSVSATASGTPLKSPMVGTAYLSPTPGLPPFAAVGSDVKEGQTLLIIEAMKTMNQITAPKAGRLVQVMIENAQPVEFGEVLMVIE